MELDQTENSFNLQSFDLGEAGGGKQMIFAHKAINDTEHYVFTLGNGPKDTQDTTVPEPTKTDNNVKTISKQILSNFCNQFGIRKNAKQKSATEQDEQQNLKLRFFKLSQIEGQKYNIEEYITPQGASDIARMFGNDQDASEMIK